MTTRSLPAPMISAEEEEEEDEDDGLGAEEDAMDGMMGGAVGFVGDKFGLRRKKFQRDIHHKSITNLGRRRRTAGHLHSRRDERTPGAATSLTSSPRAREVQMRPGLEEPRRRMMATGRSS